MTRKEFENLKNIEKETPIKIKVSDLKNKEDRTLIYGYDLDRRDFHLYLKNEKFYLINGNEIDYFFLQDLEEISKYSCIPNKRIYPEICDYEFCKLLKEKGVNFSFTVYKENFDERKIYGLTIEDLKNVKI